MRNQHRLPIALAVFFLLSFVHAATAQQAPPQTPAQTRADALRKNEARLIYPYIKGSVLSGVLPVSNPDFQVDKQKTYKLLFDFAYGNATMYSQGQVNPALEEIIRILNLHSAAGVPDKNLKPVIVLHGPAVSTFFTDAYYQEKFSKPNPNIPLIQALQAKGVELIVCGQSLQLRDLDRRMLLPGIKLAYSSPYNIVDPADAGYVLFSVNTID